MNAAELLAELAAGPDLRGAVCTDPDLRAVFDSSAPSAVHSALSACSRCPVLQSCRAWVLSLTDDQRPRGVVGGMVIDAQSVAWRQGGADRRRRRAAQADHPGPAVIVALRLI